MDIASYERTVKGAVKANCPDIAKFYSGVLQGLETVKVHIETLETGDKETIKMLYGK